MDTSTNTGSSGNYESRWFIWTLVFLLASGVGLTSYISLSEPDFGIEPALVTQHRLSQNR